MESKNTREQTKYYIIENVINKYIKDSFGENGETVKCDAFLLNMVNGYINSNGILKKENSDKIREWFINKISNKDSTNFEKCYNQFVNLVDIHGNKNPELLTLFQINNKENSIKIEYIKENSDINEEILGIVESNLEKNNSCYKFGHQLGIAETSIRLAKASNLKKEDINLLVMVSLFHDTGYNQSGNLESQEGVSYLEKWDNILGSIIKKLNIDINKFHSLMLASYSDKHEVYDDEKFKIIQDSCLEGLGKGPYYLLYSSLGESGNNFNDLNDLIEFEESFIKKIENGGSFYQSSAGKQILIHPKNSLEKIKEWPEEVVPYAKTLINQDISFDDFTKRIDEFLEAWRLF